MAFITESMLRAMLKNGIPNPFPLHEGDKVTPSAADFLRDRGIPFVRPQLELPVDRPESIDPDLSIPVGVSNRHIHVSPEDIEKLFGIGYSLTPLRYLSQPGTYAAHEQVTLVGPKGTLSGVRVLGPPRETSQVEISRTDGFELGIHPPVRVSGNLNGTPGLTVVGPKGFVSLTSGVIIAKCHVHMSPHDAEKFQVSNGDSLILQAAGDRMIVFPDVVVRVSPNYKLDFHMDLDEANAAVLNNGDRVKMTGKNGKLLSWNVR